MRVGAKYHCTALSQHLSCKLVNYRLMRRYIYPAVLFCTAETKHVVILIDSTTYGTQAVVAVREHIRHRKSLKPRCSRRLYNTYKCDIIRCELIESYLKLVHAVRLIMLF